MVQARKQPHPCNCDGLKLESSPNQNQKQIPKPYPDKASTHLLDSSKIYAVCYDDGTILTTTTTNAFSSGAAGSISSPT